MQQCPLCRGQMMTCDCRFDEDGPDEDELDDDDFGGAAEPLMVDRDGLLVERRWVGGQEVIIRYDDIPASDRTTVDGIPCTTALRTVIDIAADVDLPRLEEIVHDFLDRGLFTVDEAWRRLSQPDMANRAGAALAPTDPAARGVTRVAACRRCLMGGVDVPGTSSMTMPM